MLTADMSQVAMGVTPSRHKQIKKLGKSHELRDHMSKPELAITTPSETAAKAIIQRRDTKSFDATQRASMDVARVAREALEKQLEKKVVTEDNFLPRPDGSDTPLFAAAAKQSKPKKST
jgi:hypothetical protein